MPLRYWNGATHAVCTSAVLSPAAQLRAIVGTGTGRPGETAARSVALAREMLGLMKPRSAVPVHDGAGQAQRRPRTGPPAQHPGHHDEALRADTRLPLFVAVGAA